MPIKQLDKSIFIMPSERETDRPTLGYIFGKDYSIMIDCGNSARHVKDFINALKEQNLNYPDYSVATHWHWDHTFGMNACEGITISGDKTAEHLKRMSEWNWTDKDMKNRLITGEDIEFADTHIRAEYKDLSDIKVTMPNITFTGEITLNLGGITCHIMEMDSPHCDDAVIAHVPEKKVLFVGDALSPDFYNNSTYELAKVKNMLEKLESLDFKICVVGHGEPLPREDVLRYLKGVVEKLEQ